jgi:hypothetical protein
MTKIWEVPPLSLSVYKGCVVIFNVGRVRVDAGDEEIGKVYMHASLILGIILR